MQIGLVGKPSAGKSSFFKAATLAEVEIANYPFVTIKPNSGVGYVRVIDPAKDFGKKSNPRDGYVLGEFRFVPIQLLDVAGLVPGASEGKGMGSQFLDDLNQADALIHIIDISGSINENGEPCQPLSYDPLNDVRFLEEELDLWYLRILKNGWDKFTRQISHQPQEITKAIAKQLSGLRVTEEIAEEMIKKLQLPETLLTWTDQNLRSLATELRKRTKPMIIAANKIDVPGAEKNLERMKESFPEYHIIPCSSIAELALKEASKKGTIDYIPGTNTFKKHQDLGTQEKLFTYIQDNILNKYQSTGVQDVLNTIVFNVLKYKALYPGGVSKLEDKNGNVIPDCFLMPEKTTALEFAFRLHTDIGKGFVKAIDVRTKQPIGKDHILKHGDIIEIKTTA